MVVKEVDLTGVVPNVQTSTGAFVETLTEGNMNNTDSRCYLSAAFNNKHSRFSPTMFLKYSSQCCGSTNVTQMQKTHLR